jgi:P-type Ca2+ transporter type 2C
MAFTTLVFAQLIDVFNARSNERSAFVMQRAFGTAALTGADWLRCGISASSVLWVSELSKLLARIKSATVIS